MSTENPIGGDSSSLLAAESGELGCAPAEAGRTTFAPPLDVRPPQRRRRRLSAAHEKVLGRDSDAVLSVFYPEQRKLGALLAAADGSASALCLVHLV